MGFSPGFTARGTAARFQWAPSLTTHDPNPPLPLESVAAYVLTPTPAVAQASAVGPVLARGLNPTAAFVLIEAPKPDVLAAFVLAAQPAIAHVVTPGGLLLRVLRPSPAASAFRPATPTVARQIGPGAASTALRAVAPTLQRALGPTPASVVVSARALAIRVDAPILARAAVVVVTAPNAKVLITLQTPPVALLFGSRSAVLALALLPVPAAVHCAAVAPNVIGVAVPFFADSATLAVLRVFRGRRRVRLASVSNLNVLRRDGQRLRLARLERARLAVNESEVL